MRTLRGLAYRKRLAVALLPALAAVLLTACGADMHDDPGIATASVTLQVAGSETASSTAAVEPVTPTSAFAALQLGGGMALTRLRLGVDEVALRASGNPEAASRLAGGHVADLLGDPLGHSMGSMDVPGGLSYQMDVDVRPVQGVDGGDPEGAWAMVLELTFVDPGDGFTHTFILRWDSPAAFHMTGPDGLMMGGGGHHLILAFRMEQVFASPYNGVTLLDALLATPMDAEGVHALSEPDHPDLFAAVLAAMHDAMVFGEDMDHDGHLHDGDDHMTGHHGAGGMM